MFDTVICIVPILMPEVAWLTFLHIVAIILSSLFNSIFDETVLDRNIFYFFSVASYVSCSTVWYDMIDSISIWYLIRTFIAISLSFDFHFFPFHLHLYCSFTPFSKYSYYFLLIYLSISQFLFFLTSYLLPLFPFFLFFSNLILFYLISSYLISSYLILSHLILVVKYPMTFTPMSLVWEYAFSHILSSNSYTRTYCLTKRIYQR